MGKEQNLIIGLDIGTTKICAIVGELNPQTEEVEIIGVGTYPSYGLKRGVVVNIENTIQSVKNAVEEAEHMAGCEIRAVFVGIAGGHIKGVSGIEDGRLEFDDDHTLERLMRGDSAERQSRAETDDGGRSRCGMQ